MEYKRKKLKSNIERYNNLSDREIKKFFEIVKNKFDYNQKNNQLIWKNNCEKNKNGKRAGWYNKEIKKREISINYKTYLEYIIIYLWKNKTFPTFTNYIKY